MYWYVIQTKTGGEENTVRMIRRLLPEHLYGECFVVYLEQLWRRHGQSMVHVMRAFPGYVFITSDEPDALYLNLKRVPAMSRLIADDGLFFLSLDKAEADFLAEMMNGQHVICLSYLSTDGKGHIFQVAGPLRKCLDQVVRYNYRKRTASVRLTLAGTQKQVPLGIILNEDIRRQLCYGKVETPIPVPEQYQITALRKVQTFASGDTVTVMNGELAGITGTVSRVRKNAVRLSIHLLGQNLEIEMPSDNVGKLE